MRIWVAVVCIVTSFALAGCDQGPKGPKGSTGETGAKGDIGEAGRSGATGDTGRQGTSQSLRPIRMNKCPDDRCQMSCDADEELVSATCVGGQLDINGNSVTCGGTQGVAMALCLRR